jgi:ribosomal protein S7
MVGFKALNQTINSITSNGKRFIAYEIVRRLERQKQMNVLNKLSAAVTDSDKKEEKLHQVFESSFDAKELRTKKFIEQKLLYMHNNPCMVYGTLQ